MDQRATQETLALLGTLIGEIMEDHTAIALCRDEQGPGWAEALRQAGEEIAALAVAAQIVERRAESAEEEA